MHYLGLQIRGVLISFIQNKCIEGLCNVNSVAYINKTSSAQWNLWCLSACRFAFTQLFFFSLVKLKVLSTQRHNICAPMILYNFFVYSCYTTILCHPCYVANDLKVKYSFQMLCCHVLGCLSSSLS